MLRQYQQKAINETYAWFENNKSGHPCLELPTGSGKSHIVAALCKDAIRSWPETRILMLTHVKELIVQNAEKMLQHWPDAPLGIYSAGLRRRELGRSITFAGIQSVRKRADEIGHIDLVIVDECHLINHKNQGGYRALIDNLTEINPALRVIGLTATPYRLGHGLIIDKPALFSEIIQPTSIEELISLKYLSPLRSKKTELRINTINARKRGGEYREEDLVEAIKKFDTMGAIDETLEIARDRKSLLFFCTGVAHAIAVRDELRSRGIVAETVLGSTPKPEREKILDDFKSGRVRAVTNANVLTTGFDHPNLDCIVFFRPTLSVSLYVQMAGRGMRIKDDVGDCLVLDFAGLVSEHGPITNVNSGYKKGEGEAPTKICPDWQEINHLAAKHCSACGAAFPEPEPKPINEKEELTNDDIMGQANQMDVTSWMWRVQTSRTSGREMLAVSYYRTIFDDPIKEYITLGYPGYAGQKAAQTLARIIRHSGADTRAMTLHDAATALNKATPPSLVVYGLDGRYKRIKSRTWTHQEANTPNKSISSVGSGSHIQRFLSLQFLTEDTVRHRRQTD